LRYIEVSLGPSLVPRIVRSASTPPAYTDADQLRAMPNIEKARGKVTLAPGHSLAAWMKLSEGADLTGGIGRVDEDEDEGTWPVWSFEELAKHSAPGDAWMAVRGKVYNITPYLPYHPGGVDLLMEAAGADGTELFDKYHKWVNADGILAACCVGTLAKSGSSATMPSVGRRHAGAPSRAEPAAAAGAADAADVADARVRKRVKWDEPNLKAHDEQRGVAFGTMKIDQLNTPFLYLEDDGGEWADVKIHPGASTPPSSSFTTPVR